MKKVIIIGATGSLASIIENPELHENENLGISKPK